MRVIDISAPLSNASPAFPGDPRVAIAPTHSLAKGDAYAVSTVTMSSHAGTHVDPPCHFIAGGASIDQVDLEVLNGPCRVLVVPPADRAVSREEAARVPPQTRRVLFRTANSDRWARSEAFFSDYVALTPDAADELLARGVRLVGVDALSIEADPTGHFPVHHRLLGAGALILEGVRLAGVPEGDYELRCLPLSIRGGDGGPARAVLVAP